MISKWYVTIPVLALAALMIGCKSKPEPKQPAANNTPTSPSAQTASSTDKSVVATQWATIEMDGGKKIYLELYGHQAPKTVANFVKLAKSFFYDTLTFHRVEPGFVVQGGDPKGDGTGGPGYTIKFEKNNLKHLKGSLAMARAEAMDSAGCQFYICLNDVSQLDGKYCVFGKVIQGMDVVENIKVDDIMSRVTISDTNPLKPAAKETAKEQQPTSKQ